MFLVNTTYVYLLIAYLSSAPGDPGDTWWTAIRNISLAGSVLTSLIRPVFLSSSVLFQIRSSAPNTLSKSETSEMSNQNCLSSANCFSWSENLWPVMKHHEKVAIKYNEIEKFDLCIILVVVVWICFYNFHQSLWLCK
jgi:hypothetical protein